MSMSPGRRHAVTARSGAWAAHGPPPRAQPAVIVLAAGRAAVSWGGPQARPAPGQRDRVRHHAAPRRVRSCRWWWSPPGFRRRGAPQRRRARRDRPPTRWARPATEALGMGYSDLQRRRRDSRCRRLADPARRHADGAQRHHAGGGARAGAPRRSRRGVRAQHEGRARPSGQRLSASSIPSW